MALAAEAAEDPVVTQAQRNGWVQTSQVEQASKFRDTLRAQGEHVSLCEALVRMGFLSPAQVGMLERARQAVRPIPQIPDFDILERIGEGPLGAVYRARAKGSGQTMAVRILPRELAARPGYLEGFQAEALAAANVAHINLAAVYTFGESHGVHYLVTEYVSGRSLRQVLEEAGRLPEREAIKIGFSVADALSAAAAEGLVHCALKPENILINDEGVVKLVDLGLARPEYTGEEQQRPAAEAAEARGGEYQAPEQAEGKEVDARTDVYGLGAVLYHLVTGKPLFGGSARATLKAKQVSGEAVHPSALAPGCSKSLCAVLRMMLAKDPADRYADMDAVKNDLAPLLERRPPALAMRFGGRSTIPLAAKKSALAFWPVLLGVFIGAIVLALVIVILLIVQ